MKIWHDHAEELYEILGKNGSALESLTIVFNSADLIENDTKNGILLYKLVQTAPGELSSWMKGMLLMLVVINQKLKLEPSLIHKVLECMGTQGQLCSLTSRMSNALLLQEKRG